VVSRFARRPSHRGPSRFTIIALLAAALLAGAATPARAATTPDRAATRAAAPSAAGRSFSTPGSPTRPPFARSARVSSRREEGARSDARGEGQAYDREHAGSLQPPDAPRRQRGSYSSLMESVHPDSAYRATAEAMTQRRASFRKS